MEPIIVKDLAELEQRVGESFGHSRWVEVDQGRIDLFAQATDDHQWIHVDRLRAASGPFGTTIAHGFLTVSLGPALQFQVCQVSDLKMVINYGLNKVRFPSPVRSGSRVRLALRLLSMESLGEGSAQVVWEHVFEIEGEEKPACVAEVVHRYYA